MLEAKGCFERRRRAGRGRLPGSRRSAARPGKLSGGGPRAQQHSQIVQWHMSTAARPLEDAMQRQFSAGNNGRAPTRHTEPERTSARVRAQTEKGSRIRYMLVIVMPSAAIPRRGASESEENSLFIAQGTAPRRERSSPIRVEPAPGGLHVHDASASSSMAVSFRSSGARLCADQTLRNDIDFLRPRWERFRSASEGKVRSSGSEGVNLTSTDGRGSTADRANEWIRRDEAPLYPPEQSEAHE